jgi:hypothetical protein
MQAGIREFLCDRPGRTPGLSPIRTVPDRIALARDARVQKMLQARKGNSRMVALHQRAVRHIGDFAIVIKKVTPTRA